jgi:tetratricopeptide (TPR) repeat protein
MCRLKSASLALLVSIFVCSVAFAQRSGSSTTPSVTEIQVRVSYANERAVGQQIMVELLNQQSIPVIVTFTDSEGRAIFHITGGGVYRARASGHDIEQAVSDAMNIDPNDRSAVCWLHVQQKAGAGAASISKGSKSTAAVTSTNELRVPAGARKFFMKGMEALYGHDYPKAAELFQKATVAYPEYDAAYDNLGVTLMQLGQPDKAREAFEHAVQLNDKNADADRNYARVLMASREYPRALDLLNKSLMVDPQNPPALALVSIVRLQTGDIDGALQSALMVHQLPHEGYAVAHYVAGRAYEKKQQYQSATSEYQTYLRESPDGPEAMQVRNALAHVTSMAGTTPQPSATPQ